MSEPSGRFRLALATPLFSVAEPTFDAVPPFTLAANVTVPVGVPAVEVTVAVNFTCTPTVVVVVEAERTVAVLAAPTTTFAGVDTEAAAPAAPRYCAMML